MTDTPTAAEATSASKPKLLLAGFYGRGNAGDEALLQCLYEAYRPNFDIIIAVDERGAYPKFWDWYPYNQCKIIHQTDNAFLGRAQDLAGLIVGGGGLPVGFCANLVVTAATMNLPVFMTGVDVGTRWLSLAKSKAACLEGYRTFFRQIMVRTASSMEMARQAGLSVTYGGDLALNLPADAQPDIPCTSKTAFIVAREWGLEALSPDFFREIQKLVGRLEVAGYSPCFLPFAPEDETFLEATRIGLLAPSVIAWSNARLLKQLISRCGMLLSVGRLHPLIFAATTDTPVATVAYPMAKGYRPIAKVVDMATEFGQQNFPDIAALNQAITEGRIAPSDQQKVAAACSRLNESIAEVKAVLLRGHTSAAAPSSNA